MAKLTNRQIAALLLLGAGALFAVLYLTRKQLGAAVKYTYNSANALLFRSVIPGRTVQYTDIILRVSQEEAVSPFLIVAIMERESQSGAALSPAGPGGTGDAGHGRGLMQIDDRSFGPDETGKGSGDGWLGRNNWRDPYVNIKKGVQILKGKLSYIRGRVPGLPEQALLAAAVAAYNAGEGTVVKALQAGQSPDSHTANGNYGSDVTARAAALEASFVSKLTA